VQPTNLEITRSKIVSFYYKTLGRLLEHTPIARLQPNSLSLLALGIGLLSAVAFGTDHTFYAGLLLLFSGLLDTLDGAVARLTHTTTRFGALLDSSLDRYVEFMIFLGMLRLYPDGAMFYWTFAALVGSVMVSYTRARAEGLGSKKVVGWLQRPERMLLLATGAIINAPVDLRWGGGDMVLRWTVILIAIGANLTAVQRLLVVYRAERNGELD